MPSQKTEMKNEKVEGFKSKLNSNVEDMIFKKFPSKFSEIDDLLNSEAFSLARLPQLKQDLSRLSGQNLENGGTATQSSESDISDKPPAIKVAKIDPNSSVAQQGTKIIGFQCGVFESNTKINELIDTVKPIMREAVCNVNEVKLWITLLIPRIEDGNNFGVTIQEEVLSEVRAVEAEIASFLDQVSRYFLQRGKLVCRIAKYPHTDDYRQAIADLDEKEFFNLRLILTETRNHYVALHDMIVKNIDKIRNPRPARADHIYGN